jgi:hypothetical protein
MEQALTVTVCTQLLLEQPAMPPTVRFSTNEPTDPASTLTDCEALEPMIEPLPVIDQLYVTPVSVGAV